MSEIEVPTAREILDQVLKDVENFDPEMFPPFAKLEKGEQVIAIVEDDFLRKVFSAACFYMREGKRLQVDLESAGEVALHSPEMQRLKHKHDLLMSLFWFALRTQNNTFGVNVGIRKDWQFVSIPKKSPNQLSEIIEKLLDELTE
jgi:hypothetical protein